MTLADVVRTHLRTLITPSTILLGHSIESDGTGTGTAYMLVALQQYRIAGHDVEETQVRVVPSGLRADRAASSNVGRRLAAIVQPRPLEWHVGDRARPECRTDEDRTLGGGDEPGRAPNSLTRIAPTTYRAAPVLGAQRPHTGRSTKLEIRGISVALLATETEGKDGAVEHGGRSGAQDPVLQARIG
ncbi:hypothetical protein V8E53_000132 [Lactarius tabidus]